MKPEDKIMGKIVGEAIRNGDAGKVSIESKGLTDFLSERLEGADSSERSGFFRRIWENRGLRFFLIVATVFMMLVVTIWYMVFFISDVILYEGEFHINEQGAVNPQKALNSEYALYLFNTSDVWANPGIQVNERDRIRVSISGGFHSSIEYALAAAKENEKPQYDWERPGVLKPLDDWALDYCLSQGHEYYFGTVMYTIKPESEDIGNHPLRVAKEELIAWTPHRSFRRAGKTGNLYFAINDLVFDGLNKEDVGNNINKYYSALEKHLKDSIQTAKSRKDSVRFEGEKNLMPLEKKAVQDDPSYLYKDNLGQLLVAVEIQHPITSFWRWPETPFRLFDNWFSTFQDWLRSIKAKLFRSNPGAGVLNAFVSILYVVVLAIWGVLLFLLFGLANMGIFLVWTLLLCAVICAAFILLRFVQRLMRVGHSSEKTEDANE